MSEKRLRRLVMNLCNWTIWLYSLFVIRIVLKGTIFSSNRFIFNWLNAFWQITSSLRSLNLKWRWYGVKSLQTFVLSLYIIHDINWSRTKIMFLPIRPLNKNPSPKEAQFYIISHNPSPIGPLKIWHTSNHFPNNPAEHFICFHWCWCVRHNKKSSQFILHFF